MDRLTASEDRKRRLDEAVAAYERAEASGRIPSLAMWQACYPDLAHDLAEWVERRTSLRPETPGEVPAANAQPPANEMMNSADTTKASFDDYELLSVLGEGGMGVVWKARQRSLNRVVALKTVRPSELGSSIAAGRFRLEAEAVASLDHPGIVPIYEIGESQGGHFFSMKLVEGESLDRKLQSDAFPSGFSDADRREAARIVAAVARAVHYAHQRGILHRDMKPANILLDGNGTPHVVDFGIAKRFATLESQSAFQPVVDTHLRTGEGVVRGTPSYMSPEQAKPGESVSTAADVYGLGAVLYHLLTGRPVFEAESTFEVLRKVRQDTPVLPRAITARIPADLEAICLKCLQKSPGDRYGSAVALAEDLESWLDGKPVSARPASRLRRVVLWTRRQPALAGLAVSVAAVALVGAVLVLWQWREAVFARGQAETAFSQAKSDRDIAEKQKVAADLEKLRALQEEQRADGERKLAQAEKVRAEESEKAAKLAQNKAEAERLRAETEKTRALALRNANQIATIQREIQEGDYVNCVRAYDLLSLCDPDVIGWEHHALVAQLERRLRTFATAGSPIHETAMSRDGCLVAIAQGGAGAPKIGGKKAGGKAETPPISVTLLNASTGREVTAVKGLPEKSHSVGALAFHPNGSLLAAAFAVRPADENKAEPPKSGYVPYSAVEIRIWETETGVQRLRINDAKRGHAIAFSPDGELLAVAIGDEDGAGEIHLWDISVGKEIARLQGHTVPVRSVAFHPDGKTLASAGYISGTFGQRKGEAKLWDLTKRTERLSLQGMKNLVKAIAFRPDGNVLVTGCYYSHLQIWDTATGKEIDEFPTNKAWGNVQTLAWSADGTRLIVSHRHDLGQQKEIVVWDAGSKKPIQILPRPKVASGAVAVSHDGMVVAMANGSNLTMWTTTSPPPYRTWKAHPFQVSSLSVSRDGKTLGSASGIGGAAGPPSRGNLKLWNVGDLALKKTIEEGDLFVAFSPDGNRVVARAHRLSTPDSGFGGKQGVGKVGVWNAHTGDLAQTLESHPGGVWSGVFLGNEMIATGGGRDGTLALAALMKSLPKPRETIVWNVSTGNRLNTFEGLGPFVAAKADGKTIASVLAGDRGGGRDTSPILSPIGLVSMWDVATHARVRGIDQAQGMLRSIAFSPNDRWLAASWQGDGNASLWDLSTGKVRSIAKSHEEIINSLAFTQDGRRLATASADKTVKIWDTETGVEMLSLSGPNARATSIAFTPDDRKLIVGYASGDIAVWDAAKTLRTQPAP